VLHDITDLRRADQIRRDFVANVSHELRTPLTAIRGYVEALLDEPDDLRSSRTFSRSSRATSARMERLVRDLLRLARLDARQELLDVAPCNTEQLFHAVVSDLAPAIEKKQQRVTIAVDPEASAVLADPPSCTTSCGTSSRTPSTTRPEASTVTLAAHRVTAGS